VPLDENELIGIAKSIAKWTHANFSNEAFKAYQSTMGRIGGKLSKGGGRPSKINSDIAKKIIKMKHDGVSNREVAKKISVSPSSISYFLKNINFK
jgi:hypothetical protein